MIDKVLGKLTRIVDDGSLDGYTAVIKTSQGRIELDIELSGTPLEETIQLARDFVERIEEYLDIARNHLVGDCLPVHNAGYREDGESPVTEEAFLRKAGKPLASIDIDGEIRFTYSDEDLLWGHFMVVSIHPDGSVDTDIVG